MPTLLVAALLALSPLLASASPDDRPTPAPAAAAPSPASSPPAAAAPPLACPAGATLKGGAPPDEYEAWCMGSPDAYGNPRRHGPARAWYDDGTLRIEEHWVEGKRDGPFVEYHRNGKKARQGSYQRDDKVGTWTIWWESGGLEERSDFTRNVPDGPYAAWTRDGLKRLTGRHCLGAQCGTWITYDERGREAGRAEYGEQRSTP